MKPLETVLLVEGGIVLAILAMMIALSERLVP